MIVGIGIDVIELRRIKEAIEKNERFIQKVLTEKEQNLFNQLKGQRQIEFMAGRFAAKEALAKAMGTGIGKLSFLDMEVLKDDKNKPVMLCGKCPYKIWVSISHSQTTAIAQVILEENT